MDLEVAPLGHLFPNLEVLRLHDKMYIPLSEGSLADHVRARNRRAQAQGPAWPELKVLSGGVQSIYTAAPRCQLERLETNVRHTETTMLQTVLMDTQPRQLLLDVDWSMPKVALSQFTDEGWSRFHALFQQALELVEIRLEFTLAIDVLPVEEFLVSMSDAHSPELRG